MMGTFQLENACWATVIALGIMALYIYLLSVARKKMDLIKRILFAIAVIGGVAVYYYGYATISKPFSDSLEHPNMANAMILLKASMSTAKTLFLIPDWTGVKTTEKSVWYAIAFFITHLSALLFFMVVATSLFANNLSRFLKLRFFAKKIFIFFDSASPSLTLAKQTGGLDIFLNTKEVPNEDCYCADVAVDKILKIGGMRHALTHKECHLFFLSDNEDKNATEALKVINLLEKGDHIKLYVRIFSQSMQTIFEDKAGTKFEYSIINDSQMIAQKIVTGKNNPVYDVTINDDGTVADDFEVLILGMGTYGSAALSALIEYGQFVGSTFKATIIDNRVDERLGQYFANNPGVKEHYQVESIDLKVGSQEFFNQLTEICKSVKRVVVALGNDHLNIRIALTISKTLQNIEDNKVKIFTVVHGEDNLASAEILSSHPNVFFVGQLEEIYNYSMVVNEKLSVQAKLIHEYYNNFARAQGQLVTDWKDLPYIKRESNISASVHSVTKLRLAGLDVEQVAKMKKEEFNKKIEKCRENLAQTEHLRWNASYFVRGWQKMDISSNPSVNQDHARSLHACLVSWDELADVEKSFGSHYRDYDRKNVDAIYELVQNALIK